MLGTQAQSMLHAEERLLFTCWLQSVDNTLTRWQEFPEPPSTRIEQGQTQENKVSNFFFRLQKFHSSALRDFKIHNLIEVIINIISSNL